MPEPDTLLALRQKVAALRAAPCGMAHESIPTGPDGAPVRSTRSPSGYARAGICPEATRAVHLGCSHTMARYALRDVLERLPGADVPALLAELHELDQAIGILDHRRYDAETRRADAAGDDEAAANDVAALVAEHDGYVARVARLRREVLRRLDDALAGPPQ